MPGHHRSEFNERLRLVPETDWAYLAGIIDGEGHFSGTMQTGAPVGIKVNMAERQVPQWLHKTFGGRLTHVPNEPPRRDQWRWEFNRQRDLAFALDKMASYLRMKSDEAQAMQAWVRHCLAQPQYDRPTSTVPLAERLVRGETWRTWRAERIRLAADIRRVRNARKAA